MPEKDGTLPASRTAAVTALVVVLSGCLTALLARSTVEGIVQLGMFPQGAVQLWSVPAAWLAGTALAAAALAVGRARPLVVAVVVTALGILSLVTSGVLGILGACVAIAVYRVASARSAPVTWAAVAVVFVALTAAMWRWQDIGAGEMALWAGFVLPEGIETVHRMAEPEFSAGRRTASAAFLLVLLLLAVATGSGVRARRLDAQAVVDRREATARDHEASAALGRASERARIAREMHDIVAHSVSVMIALSDGAAAVLDHAPDRSREALRELSRTGRSALSDMQGVLGALDPADEREAHLDPMEPTEINLQTIVDRFRTAGLPLTATGLDVALLLDTTVRLALVRIVSEALTNALRHAHGVTSVQVAVRRSDTDVEVEVLDDASPGLERTGAMMPGVQGSGRGLSGMRERAALLGGHVLAGPRTGGGWRVLVVLPCATEG